MIRRKACQCLLGKQLMLALFVPEPTAAKYLQMSSQVWSFPYFHTSFLYNKYTIIYIFILGKYKQCDIFKLEHFKFIVYKFCLAF